MEPPQPGRCVTEATLPRGSGPFPGLPVQPSTKGKGYETRHRGHLSLLKTAINKNTSHSSSKFLLNTYYVSDAMYLAQEVRIKVTGGNTIIASTNIY